MSSKIKGYLLPVFLILLFVISIVISASLHQYTIIEWWNPAIKSLGLASIVSMVIYAIFFVREKLLVALLKTLVTLVVCTSLFSVGFYALNYYKSDSSTRTECRAELLRKYSEEHYHTRRVGRNRVVRGRKYYVYKVEVAFSDGLTKKLEVPAQKYSKASVGKPLTVSVEKGCFGVPVVKELSFN